MAFVADVANSVLLLLDDRNLLVRTKAAWSLGNVSDAMCSNRLVTLHIILLLLK